MRGVEQFEGGENTRTAEQESYLNILAEVLQNLQERKLNAGHAHVSPALAHYAISPQIPEIRTAWTKISLVAQADASLLSDDYLHAAAAASKDWLVEMGWIDEASNLAEGLAVQSLGNSPELVKQIQELTAIIRNFFTP